MSEIETAVLDYEKPAATLQQDADFKKKSPTKTSTAISQDVLRQCAWEIGESKPAEAYQPGANHAGLTMVSPGLGFAHWRICSGWIDQVEREKGDYWNNCRMLLRLYDVSWIEFNGFNAHCIEDHELPEICGRRFFPINRPGSWQIAEIGFLLRTGEFIPAARSNVVRFSPISSSSRHDQAGLLVEDGHVEEVGNVWDQERILNERRRPKLRPGLRIATLAFSSRVSGQADDLSDFVSELAAQQCAKGHRVHVFVPAQNEFHQPCEVNGVHYEPIGIPLDLPPIEQAQSYAQAIKERLQDFDSFDLVHAHEWMAAAAANHFNATRVLSLSSIEKERQRLPLRFHVSRD